MTDRRLLTPQNSRVDLGDTGQLTVRGIEKGPATGGVHFLLKDGPIEVGTIMLTKDKSLYILAALCKILGIKEIRPGSKLLVP